MPASMISALTHRFLPGAAIAVGVILSVAPVPAQAACLVGRVLGGNASISGSTVTLYAAVHVHS